MTTPADLSSEIHVIAAAQLNELTAALSTDSDLDFAFHLQMQEALSHSLSLLPTTSNPPPPLQPASSSPPSTSSSALQAEYLDAFLLEHDDCLIAESEFRRAKQNLLIRTHDRHVAEEIVRIPQHDWDNTGDHFQIPFGQGTSKGNSNNDENITTEFRVYCKGLVSGDAMGLGVAVCDYGDNVVFEMRKPVVAGIGKSRLVVELKAVIEGLTAAVELDLKRVVFCFDHYPVHQYVVGRWTPKQRKLVTLVNHVNQLREKFESSTPSLIAGSDIKFATKLAREAIVSQLNRPSEFSSVKNMNESCGICLEDKEVSQFFAVDNCSHRYCFSCMKQHVEVKLLHGMMAKCPHEGCNSELKIESCRIFLTPKLVEMMTHRLKEASIPVSEKVYCPYPKCSFLMTRTEVSEYSGKLIDRSGMRKCIQCEDFFCIYCKVPWHNNMSCFDYKRKNPHPPAEDAKLKTLANQKLWRQCVKCNHMIELDAGCYHMTCRCGYEFCYTCGAEWKNKKPTCSCRLWDEYNIMDQDYESDEELDDYNDHDYLSDSDDYY